MYFAQFWKQRRRGSRPAERPSRSSSISQIEHLESRLCLGGIGLADPGSSDTLPYDDWSSETATEVYQLLDQSDSLLNGSLSADILAGLQAANAGDSQSPGGSGNAIVSANSAGGAAADSQLVPAALASALPTNGINGEASPEPAAGTGAAELFDRTIASGSTDPMSTRSSGAGTVDNPSESSLAVTATGQGGYGATSMETPAPSVDTNAVGLMGPVPSQSGSSPAPAPGHAWFQDVEGPVTLRYDFRDNGGYENLITEEQKAAAIAAFDAWSTATGGQLVFVHDTAAPISEIVNVGRGDLAAFNTKSAPAGTLSLGGGVLRHGEDGNLIVTGIIWLDEAESWDSVVGNGNPAGTYDVFTAVAHETGNVLGYDEVFHRTTADIMHPVYSGEQSLEAIHSTVQFGTAHLDAFDGPEDAIEFRVRPLMGAPQLSGVEVQLLLERAAAASASEDAIIAVVDRQGNILGVRVEADVLAMAPSDALLSFMIDGAVAKARTAAFFANDTAPLTSRLVRFISQSTVTQREVESNPNDMDPTRQGPGFVAPIGLGGHFPPEIAHTPPVDLFAIEHTNRDSIVHPGPNGIRESGFDAMGNVMLGGDDILLTDRFNATFIAGQSVAIPESYGFASGRAPTQQSRGIATLPGGIPLYRDTSGNGIGDTLIGGIGVFFPGTDGYATHEQNFIAGIGQSELERTNADKVLEAEYIAFAAAGGSNLAQALGAFGAKYETINGVPAVAGLDIPFGRIDLVGITLPILGQTAGIRGVQQVVAVGRNVGFGNPNSGADQPVERVGPDGMLMNGDELLYLDGDSVPEGWLVAPKGSLVDNLTAADVQAIIMQGVEAAEKVRAAIRLPLSSRTSMVLAVTDTTGEVLGLFRMPDSTFFSLDVAVAKARNTAYYADAAALQPADQVPGVNPGTAFTNRTFRFLAEPRFPSGVDFSQPPVFSILNDPGINPLTAENIGAPTPAGAFTSVLGYDAFNPNTNFRDPANIANQNGVVFFPGSTPLYKNGVLVGGLGVSGDGVDQDDVVTFIAAQGFLPNNNGVLRADQVAVNGVRLPYIKFLRNPFG